MSGHRFFAKKPLSYKLLSRQRFFCEKTSVLQALVRSQEKTSVLQALVRSKVYKLLSGHRFFAKKPLSYKLLSSHIFFLRENLCVTSSCPVTGKNFCVTSFCPVRGFFCEKLFHDVKSKKWNLISCHETATFSARRNFSWITKKIWIRPAQTRLAVCYTLNIKSFSL